MIKVQRRPLPAVLDLDEPTSPAFVERQAIIDFMDANNGDLPKNMDFNIYRDASVKRVLIEMFHRKCAYCEWDAVVGSDGDIEHYRPKKGVTDADNVGVEHPGYWWLAMQWENLLLSCQHCNQSRRQLIHEPGLSEEEIERERRENRLRTTGKKNRFPVEGDAWVVVHTGDVADENPLLINPCDTDPEALLEWEFERSISTVKARNGDARANATIDILGLNRRYLTEARVTLLNDLRKRRRKVLQRLNRALESDNAAETDLLLTLVAEDLKLISESGEANRPFSGLSRAFYKKLRAEVDERLA